MIKQILAAGVSILGFYSSPAQSIDSVLAKYGSEYQPEKIYLHFDKSAYHPGETIWFKAYLMDGLFPAEQTKTVYVDWIKPDGTVLQHTVTPVIDGGAHGQFDLPQDMTANVVHVRAYTRWMLNFDTAFLFRKNIPVFQKSQIPKNTKRGTTSFHLFPEGGDMIDGVMNRVAFKATDPYGMPVKISGVLLKNNLTVDTLKVQHDGMGFFFIHPEPGASYSVRWKDQYGVEKTSPLPRALTTGVALSISSQGTKRIVTLSPGIDLPQHLKQLHLVGTINNHLAFKTSVIIENTSAVRRVIPTESLPSGIMTVTLLDANWKAIAERITFLNNNEYGFETSMEVLHWGLGKRKRNEIMIRVPDSLSGNLSISVTDAAIEKDTSENIISYILLSSDIRGYVHQPSYYFAGNEEKRKEHLDLVMMTNGWRRFKWEELARSAYPKIANPKDTSYLSLSGQLMGVAKGQLSGEELLVLLIKDKDSATKIHMVPINRDGSFSDPEYIFFDTLNVYYSLKSKLLKQAEARFMINRLPTPNYSAFSKGIATYAELYDTTGIGYHYNIATRELTLKEQQRHKIMETVVVKTKTKTPMEAMEEKYPSGMFKGGDGYQFDLLNDPLAGAYLNVLTFLQGRVPGLSITNGINPELSWRGGTPQLFLDEMPVDATLISSIPVRDIAYVKVFRGPFMGGFNGGNGAIAIYTRRGDDVKSSSGGLTGNKIFGYTAMREFYAPNYDKFVPSNEQQDLRTTLYWNPRILVSGNKPVKLVFYNNDVTKSFRVVIQGISTNGLLTKYEQIME